VGKNAFCETAEFDCCVLKPVVSIGTTDELGVLVGFAGGCIYDGVCGVECFGDVIDVGVKAVHMMLNDNVGLDVAAAGVMGMMNLEALSKFSVVGASCGGTTFGPRCAGNSGVGGDAGPQECGLVGRPPFLHLLHGVGVALG
jgi:hypothetical protein